MANDTQIFNGASTPAPKDYTLPGNSELLLKAVHASFTDNSASGDWLPCVTLISDSGHKIAQAVDQGVKVAAGSDAEVSWFPHLRHAAVASSGGGAVDWCAITFAATIPAGDEFGTTSFFQIASFNTSNSALYSQVDAQTWSTPGTPQWLMVTYTRSAFAFQTTNGKIIPLLYLGTGQHLVLHGEPSGVTVEVVNAHRGLTTVAESTSPYTLGLAGTETHSWTALLWMFNAVGTTGHG